MRNLEARLPTLANRTFDISAPTFDKGFASQEAMRLREAWRTFHHAEASHPTSLQIGRNGFMLVGLSSGAMCLWDSFKETVELEVKFLAGVSALCWLGESSQPEDAFAVGCADGMVYIYCLKNGRTWDRVCEMDISRTAPVEGIAWDSTHRYIAVAAGHIHVHHISTQYRSRPITSTHPCTSTPRYVSFLNNGDELVVCYLESREVCCYDMNPFTLRWSCFLPTRIGHAALIDKGNYLAVYNLSSGVDLYDFPILSNAIPVRTLPIASSLDRISLIAVPGDAADIVICGGPAGMLNVFDLGSGLRIARLNVGTGLDFVSLTAAATIGHRGVISGACLSGRQVSIKLWDFPLEQDIVEGPVSTPPLYS
ncbi:WD40-repeat-containing domain protein [Coprinopsis sp. MPI-PUGE-AT-0042]|nr:WD40-repeat-containing domain protein [Coprinopsis sp. MPI-PUGE-AT-0042]